MAGRVHPERARSDRGARDLLGDGDEKEVGIPGVRASDVVVGDGVAGVLVDVVVHAVAAVVAGDLVGVALAAVRCQSRC